MFVAAVMKQNYRRREYRDEHKPDLKRNTAESNVLLLCDEAEFIAGSINNAHMLSNILGGSVTACRVGVRQRRPVCVSRRIKHKTAHYSEEQKPARFVLLRLEEIRLTISCSIFQIS